MLKLTDIKKTYTVGDNKIQALKGVSLEFRESEFVSILGPSGCGKTTMLNIVGGLDRYDAGDIMIDGKSTKQFKSSDWDAYRNNFIGFVFQSYNLISHQTVLRNVELALTIGGIGASERRKRAVEALESVGLGDQLYKRTNQISGGQMQRVAIARALVNNPQVILADEPTGALDSTTSVQIMEILKEVAKDRLVIMVTHNGDLAAKYSTRIIKLKDGELLSDSNPLTDAAPIEAGETDSQKPADDNKLQKLKVNRTSMSFITALRLSFKNLFTKKVRTFITAFAGSIGIISVALVLAITNGFSGEISRMQRGALADFPIQINRQHIDFMAAFGGGNDDSGDLPEFPDSDEIVPHNPNMFANVTRINNITNEYVSHINDINDSLVNSIEFRYGYQLNMLSIREGAATYSAPNRGRLNMQVLPSNEEFLNRNYEVLYSRPMEQVTYDARPGHRYAELTLIVDTFNRLNINTITELGFGLDGLTFAQILDEVEFAVVPNDVWFRQLYTLADVLADMGMTQAEYDALTEAQRTAINLRIDTFVEREGQVEFAGMAADPESVTLRITQVLRRRRDTVGSILSPGIAYSPALERMMLQIERGATEEASGVPGGLPMSNLVRLQNENPFSPTHRALIDFDHQVVPGFNIPILAGTPFLALELDDRVPEGTGREARQALLRRIGGDNMPAGGEADRGSLPTTILIFARDFDSRNQVLAHLDRWNVGRAEEYQIEYLDLSEIIVGAMTAIIDGIAIIFTAFASISLVVSSIMIGIITYVSVLERTKEIGILRAIGARKRDISRVFNAETSLIGFAAGLIGMIIAALLTIPANFIMLALVPTLTGTVAVVAWWHPLLLISVSVMLTLAGGFIPSQLASRKDPVKALRTE